MASFLDGHGGYCTCTRDKCTDDCATYRRFKPKPMTNADRIRSMMDKELAEKMSGLESFALTCGGGWPPEKWLDWLRQEAE